MRLEELLSETLKASNSPRLLTLFVSFAKCCEDRLTAMTFLWDSYVSWARLLFSSRSCYSAVLLSLGVLLINRFQGTRCIRTVSPFKQIMQPNLVHADFKVSPGLHVQQNEVELEE